jgi:hypothetical protein
MIRVKPVYIWLCGTSAHAIEYGNSVVLTKIAETCSRFVLFILSLICLLYVPTMFQHNSAHAEYMRTFLKIYKDIPGASYNPWAFAMHRRSYLVPCEPSPRESQIFERNKDRSGTGLNCIHPSHCFRCPSRYFSHPTASSFSAFSSTIRSKSLW